jgi:ADP-heptose:LPS heptosyltransferase
MHIDTLRVLDRSVGVPLCVALTFVRRVTRLFSGGDGAPTPRRILIIKLSEMGSTVLAYPALAELKKRYQDAEFFFLVFRKNAAIVDVLELVPNAHVITVDYGSFGELARSGGRAMLRLWRARIDTAIDMDLFSRLTAIVSYLVCRGNRVGFDRYNDEGLYRGDLLTHRVIYSPHIHTAAAFTALARTLTAQTGDEPYYRGHVDHDDLTLVDYQPTPADLRAVHGALNAAGVAIHTGTPLILINPNSSDVFPLRKWPIGNYAALCRRLLTELPESRLVITGVASEGADARIIFEQLRDPRCVDFTGQTSFRQLLALYAVASLMITNDSGPAHFASLLKLPTVVLFGPETPALFSPLGDTHTALYARLACSPCVSVYNGKKSTCSDNRCLQMISVDQTLTAALAWLTKSKTRGDLTKST